MKEELKKLKLNEKEGKMKKFLLLISLSGCFVFCYSQISIDKGLKYSKTITAKELKSNLQVIASDSFAGREAGHPGQKMAMEYLINNFKVMGIKPIGDTGYTQKFPLIEQKNSGITIRIDGNELKQGEDFYIFNHYFRDTILNSTAFFADYGLEGSYNKTSLKNKVAIIFDAYPDNDSSKWDLGERVEYAKKNGASAIMVINNEFQFDLAKYNHYLNRSRMWLNTDSLNSAFPVFYISYQTAEDIFPSLSMEKFVEKGKTKKLYPQKISIRFQKPSKNLTSENVLAYIPGSDLKEELLVITAHYDHLGRQDSLIYNGADDDGSGTVALLEIAEAFMLAKQAGDGPRRSVLIMPVSAEEKGLLGSEYYSNHPVFPLKNSVANLNVDMIGRIDEKHQGNPNYIYLIGSDRLSQDLHEISENIADSFFDDIELDYTFNAPDDPNRFYYRSDHYNFAKHNIPAIFYFSGVHEDYHKPTDTVDKILFDKAEEISRLIFLTAWEIVNRDERPQLNENIMK